MAVEVAHGAIVKRTLASHRCIFAILPTVYDRSAAALVIRERVFATVVARRHLGEQVLWSLENSHFIEDPLTLVVWGVLEEKARVDEVPDRNNFSGESRGPRGQDLLVVRAQVLGQVGRVVDTRNVESEAELVFVSNLERHVEPLMLDDHGLSEALAAKCRLFCNAVT